MGTTRDAVVTCRVCHRAYAKYTCPRCFTRYCALACYKAHDSRCVQSFHGENLGDAMRGLTVEDEDKRRMTEILAKYADREPDGGDERPLDEPLPLDEHAHDAHDEHDEHDDDDEDDERGTCVLSEANLEKLSRGLDLTPADLDPRERAAFERAAATGELSHMVEAWTPWWTRPESCDITLARDGTKIIRELAAHTSDTFEPPGSSRDAAAADETASSSASPPSPPEEPLPPTSRLTSAAPSPALRWHLLDVLAAYTLTMRAHDGDWRADPRPPASTLLALSPTLSAGASSAPDRSSLPETAAAAMHGVVAERARRPRRAASWRRRRRPRRLAPPRETRATCCSAVEARRWWRWKTCGSSATCAAAEATAEGRCATDAREAGGGTRVERSRAWSVNCFSWRVGRTRWRRRTGRSSCWRRGRREKPRGGGEPPPAKSRARNTSRGRSWRRRDARAGEGANAVRGGSDGGATRLSRSGNERSSDASFALAKKREEEGVASVCQPFGR